MLRVEVQGMSFTLGRAPEAFKLILVSNADFISGLRRTDGQDWSDTIEVTIEIETDPITRWVGGVSGDLIEWNVDVAEVQPVYDQRPRKAKLWYIDGEIRLVWAEGAVVLK